jgi:hypothetical protein
MSNPAAGTGLESVYPVLFFIVIAAIVGIILFAFFKMIRKRTLPLLMVDARVVSKRSETEENGEEVFFVAFDLPTGDRMELRASREESEMLAEGDEGKVSFQGIRFVAFYDKISNQ